jgi:hypothetical protein
MSYLIVLLVWPYADTRFWIPLLPFVLAYLVKFAHTALTARQRIVAITVSSVWLLVVGGTALAYSTRLSFAGDAFAELYGDESTHLVYSVAFHHLPASAELAQGEDGEEVRLLQRFEPRASNAS